MTSSVRITPRDAAARQATVTRVRAAARRVRMSEGSCGAVAARATLPAHEATARTCVVATRRKWRARASETAESAGDETAALSHARSNLSIEIAAPTRRWPLDASTMGGAWSSATAETSMVTASRCGGWPAAAQEESRPVGPAEL
eukprot:71257-Pleurochrysis_carterae.AAC.1